MKKLYFSPGACSLAVHVVLEEIGEPFECQLVSVPDGQTTTEEYRRINPLQRVPVLEIDGERLTEVGAILHYLADSVPAKSLAPSISNPWLRARSLEWCSFLASSVHISFAQIWRTARFSDESTATNGIELKGRANVARFFEMIENRLKFGQFALGEDYSICDPYLLVFYRWGHRIGLPMQPYSRWNEHAVRVARRPAVKRVLEREGIRFDG